MPKQAEGSPEEAEQAPAKAAAPGHRPARGEELDLRVDSLAFGGNGVARLDGYVVFVQGAVPGDRVLAEVVKRKRAYAEARTTRLLEPSPERIEPRAEHPGAPWQVLPYERQLAEKQAQVGEALSRIGRFQDPPVEPIVRAESQWRYRNKLEYSFGPGLALGFHRAGRWDLIDDVTDDVLASERVNELREAVKRWCASQGLEPYDRSLHTGFLRNLVVREGRRTGQLQARLVTSPGELDGEALAAALPADSVLWTTASGVAETTAGGDTRILRGQPALNEQVTVAGEALSFRVSYDAFFQTNTEMAERLYSAVSELAGLCGSERVFDLFCGIGTIALALAGRAREVWGLEVSERAAADAIENARENRFENVSFFAGDARTALRPLVEEAGSPDVVVLDPPRSGLSQKVVRRVLETGAERIVYVSCNPTTLAPNARQIVDAGYRLRTVRPVDMFPQTPHIECVALLERSAGAAQATADS